MDSYTQYKKNLVSSLTKKPNTFIDKLLAYYFDEDGTVNLSAEEDKLRERYERIFTMYNKWGSYETAIRMIIKKEGLSRAQAYRDLKVATKLFGEVKKVPKEARKHILIEMGHRTYNMAKKSKDLDAMNKAHKNLIMLEGFDNEDANLPDFSSFEQHIYNIVVDPVAVGLPSVNDILSQAGVSSMDELMAKFKVRKQQKDILNIDAYQKGG